MSHSAGKFAQPEPKDNGTWADRDWQGSWQWEDEDAWLSKVESLLLVFAVCLGRLEGNWESGDLIYFWLGRVIVTLLCRPDSWLMQIRRSAEEQEEEEQEEVEVEEEKEEIVEVEAEVGPCHCHFALSS